MDKEILTFSASLRGFPLYVHFGTDNRLLSEQAGSSQPKQNTKEEKERENRRYEGSSLFRLIWSLVRAKEVPRTQELNAPTVDSLGLQLHKVSKQKCVDFFRPLLTSPNRTEPVLLLS